MQCYIRVQVYLSRGKVADIMTESWVHIYHLESKFNPATVISAVQYIYTVQYFMDPNANLQYWATI